MGPWDSVSARVRRPWATHRRSEARECRGGEQRTDRETREAMYGHGHSPVSVLSITCSLSLPVRPRSLSFSVLVLSCLVVSRGSVRSSSVVDLRVVPLCAFVHSHASAPLPCIAGFLATRTPLLRAGCCWPISLFSSPLLCSAAECRSVAVLSPTPLLRRSGLSVVLHSSQWCRCRCPPPLRCSVAVCVAGLLSTPTPLLRRSVLLGCWLIHSRRLLHESPC